MRSFTGGNAHRLDGHRLVKRNCIEPRHAHQFRHTIDLCRTRTALARFAIPTASQIRRRLRLYLMHRIKHDHSFRNLGLIVNHFRSLASAASNTKCRFCIRYLTQGRKVAKTQRTQQIECSKVKFLPFASLLLCVFALKNHLSHLLDHLF